MGQFDTRTTPSGALVIRPEGRLNMVAAPGLRKELHALVDNGNNRIVVDLSGTEFIDSSGLGALISGLKAARQAGGDLRIAAPTRQVITVLELTTTACCAVTNRPMAHSMTPDERHVLETTTGPETLDDIQRILDEVWRDYEVPEIVRIHMDLAASEIGANIIEHSGAGKPVRLRMEVCMLPDAVQATFTDDGRPAAIALGDVGLPGELDERGRGLAMAHRVLDELSYRRDNQGNHWTLVRKRTMDE